MEHLSERNLTDLHIHFCDAKQYGELVRFCDLTGITKAGLVSLPDLKQGNFNTAVLMALRKSPERFIGFGCLDHRFQHNEIGGANQVRQLSKSGFSGLKLWLGKPAVQHAFDIKMEDEYISGALNAASDLGMPVLIHIADPPDFWEPGGDLYLHVDHNTKTGSTNDYPGRFENWIDRGLALFSRFSEIKFIGAHLLFLAGGLEKLDSILDAIPNLYLDTSPGRWFYRKLAEQKKSATEFFEHRAERLFFGSDSCFLPLGYTLLPPVAHTKKRVAFDRILKFVSGTEFGGTVIDDPYPWADYEKNEINETNRSLPCLSPSKTTIARILRKNAECFFKEGGF
jgi:predicted TIM-barrel fold metal-dependent hydrolase